MKFDLIRYYDTCCAKCGNWASGDINPAEMRGNKVVSEKALIRHGWKVVDNETICNYCLEGNRR